MGFIREPLSGHRSRAFFSPRARALAAQLAEGVKESGMPNVSVQPIVARLLART
jgi:hypothetical protein